MATSTVTIDKAYFETLLRRAQFHTSGVDFTTPISIPTVTIPKLDHDSLLRASRAYSNLRRNLFKGGVNEETLAILTNDDAVDGDAHDGMTNNSTLDDTSETGVFMSQYPKSLAQPTATSLVGAYNYVYGRTKNNSTNRNGVSNGYTGNNHLFDESSTIPDGPIREFHGNGNGPHEQGRGKQYQKNAKRTICLSNLGEAITHADITDSIKGGMLLDVYLRHNDHLASISFLEERDANEFFRHAKRNDLYIRGKRVNIGWGERQFILPNHVANKVAIGATRNLVIRNVNSKHNEQAIRNDLEHIHNLVVIRVTFSGHDAHIATNSVHNAMFARTCMMSRSTYRGCKIEWDVDECAVSIQKPAPACRKENGRLGKATPLTNRFELLDLDGNDDSAVEDGLDPLSLPFQPSLSVTARVVA